MLGEEEGLMADLGRLRPEVIVGRGVMVEPGNREVRMEGIMGPGWL